MKKYNDKAFIRALNDVASTPSGQIVLAMLHRDCGWDKTFLSSESPQTTHYFATRRGVYGGLRQHIKPEYLMEIEFNHQFIAEKQDGRNNTAVKRSARSKPRAK